MRLQLLLLETIRIVVPGAALRPLEADARRQIENHGPIRHDTVDRHTLQTFDEALLQVAGDALIDARRIHETVAQHDRTLVERRPDDLFDMIAPGRCKEDRLHPDPEGLRGSRKKHVAHRFGAG
ncbi:hypothetical protein D9M70_465950 [compost metagenome]